MKNEAVRISILFLGVWRNSRSGVVYVALDCAGALVRYVVSDYLGCTGKEMSAQKQDHGSVKVVIVGVSGTGKSTLFERLIKKERGVKWIFLYDHKSGDLARRFGVRPCFDEDELIEAIERGGYVIFDPRKKFPGDKAKGFAWFCWWLWEIKDCLRGRKLFGADELEALCDERSKPRTLLRILDEGRTYQFDCFFIAQSMNGMHNQVRKQITEIFAMRQGDVNGIAFLDGKFPRELKIDWENLPNGIWHYKNTQSGKVTSGGQAFEPKGIERDLRGL